jgi:hypothetical protein
MEYLKIDTNEVINEDQLKQLNPNVSFGLPLNDSSAEALGVKVIQRTDMPDTDEFYHAEPDGVEEVDGVWREKWKIVADFEEYTDQKTNAVVSVEEQILNKQKSQARTKRDDLLKATDHFGLADVNVSAEMTAYRQALRDVPQQAGFPGEITWPTKPE